MTRTVRRRLPCPDCRHHNSGLAGGALGLFFSPVQVQEGDDAPAMTSLEITSDPGDDSVHGYDDHIRVTVTFSEDVVVAGYPNLIVEIGDREARARYGSVSGGEVVSAAWVSNSDRDTDGVSVK